MGKPKKNSAAEREEAGPSEEYGQGNHRRSARRHQEDPGDLALESDEEVQVIPGAVGGLVGDPEVGERYAHVPPDFRSELAPFIRDMMREEIQGFLTVQPAPVLAPDRAARDDFPLGQGAVPRRSAPGTGASPVREGPRDGLPAEGARNREDLSVKVKPFEPKETDWYAWRTQFVSIAEQAGWTPRTRVLRLMGALQGNMAGVTAGLPSPVTYEALLARIDGIYGLENTREDAALRLQSLRMEPGAEGGVALFAERVRQLCVRAYPNYTERDREEQALRSFLQGLPTRNDFRYQMRTRDFSTLREAVEFGSRLEQIIRDERGEPRRGAVRSAQQDSSPLTLDKLAKELHRWRELQSRQLETQTRQLETLTRQLGHGGGLGRGAPNDQGQRRPGFGERRTPQNTPCNLCGELGHWYRDCPRKPPTGHGGRGGGAAGGSQGRPGPASN